MRAAVHEHAAHLREEYPGIDKIIWFGSRVGGHPTPGSDVDLCIVLEEDPRPPRHRMPDFLPAGFPVGVDLLVYTEEEFARLEEEHPGFYRAIMAGTEV